MKTFLCILLHWLNDLVENSFYILKITVKVCFDIIIHIRSLSVSLLTGSLNLQPLNKSYWCYSAFLCTQVYHKCLIRYQFLHQQVCTGKVLIHSTAGWMSFTSFCPHGRDSYYYFLNFLSNFNFCSLLIRMV